MRHIRIGNKVLGKPEPVEDKISKGVIDIERTPDEKDDNWVPISVPDTSPQILSNAFEGVSNLETISFPNITTIGTTPYVERNWINGDIYYRGNRLDFSGLTPEQITRRLEELFGFGNR